MNDMKLQDVVVKDILMEMRKYRMGLIQTADQLRFSYLAIIEGINKAVSSNGMVVIILNLINVLMPMISNFRYRGTFNLYQSTIY